MDGLRRDATATPATRKKGDIELLDELRACAEFEIFREVEQDEEVIGRIVSAQREELEREIAGLQAEAERVADEARELAGEVPF